MAIQNNQWQYRGLTVSGSYQRIVRIQWEADSTKTYYDDTLNNGTVREEANVNVRLGTYANYNERTGSDKHIVKEEDIFIKVPMNSTISGSILSEVYTALKKSWQWEYSGSAHIQDV